MFLQSNYPQYPPSWQQTRLFSLRNTEALLQLNLHSGWKRTESCLRLHAFRRRLACLRNRKCQLKHESCLHFNNWCLEMFQVFEKWKLEDPWHFLQFCEAREAEVGSIPHCATAARVLWLELQTIHRFSQLWRMPLLLQSVRYIEYVSTVHIQYTICMHNTYTTHIVNILKDWVEGLPGYIKSSTSFNLVILRKLPRPYFMEIENVF